MSDDPMRILVVEPTKDPYVKEIDGSLASMQAIVGGFIQAVEPFDDQPFPCLFIVSGSVAPFPAPVLSFSDVPFPICPFLCHVCASFVLVAQTTTTEVAQSLLIFSEDRNIF